jgi:hypothetical protein
MTISAPTAKRHASIGIAVIVLAGFIAPVVLMLALRNPLHPAPVLIDAGRIWALAIMAAAVLASADKGRLSHGLSMALGTMAICHFVARKLGMPPLAHPVSTALAVIIASTSFAARGRLFAHALGSNGLWMGLFVVAGEAAILFTAMALPGTLPDWLLALLPAQWASTAIQTALTGTGTRAAASPLIALAGTAAATLLVARLLPRRWPYLIMFTTWIGLSALVWHRPGPPHPRADMAIAAAPGGPVAPIATAPPDAATASAIARVKRQIASWAPAGEPDLSQRARNLLLIAAVPDLYDTEPLQSHLPSLVAAELKARIPADRLPVILADIARHPEAGSVAARTSLPQLGLAGSTGSEAPVRNRMSLYAAQLAARQP